MSVECEELKYRMLDIPKITPELFNNYNHVSSDPKISCTLFKYINNHLLAEAASFTKPIPSIETRRSWMFHYTFRKLSISKLHTVRRLETRHESEGMTFY